MRKIYLILAMMPLGSMAIAQEITKIEAASPNDTIVIPAPQMVVQETVYESEPQKKTWSFYANVGVGYSTPVTLEGLQMSDEDKAYFDARGLKPSFQTQGTAKVVPTFKVGASYYFFPFRVSLDMGSQYVNQTNYHANNFNLDGMFGVSPLKGNHEFNIDLGLGYYALWNDYYYSWKGLDSKGNIKYQDGEPEQRIVYLGKHDVNTLSIPFKLSYLYNLTGRHWLGCYFHGRVNCASEAFCPRFAMAAGIEYRFTLGTRKKSKPAQTYCDPVPVYSPCMPMPCPPASCCSEQVRPRKGSYYNNNSVYSPIYIVVTPGTNVHIDTPEGTKINATSNAPVEAPKDTVVAKPAEYAQIAEQSIDAMLIDGKVMLLFEIGSDVITNTAKRILDGLDLEGINVIEVTASTCAKGSKSANEQLGKKRLEAVKKYLRERKYEGFFMEGNSQNDSPDPDWRSVFLRLVK